MRKTVTHKREIRGVFVIRALKEMMITIKEQRMIKERNLRTEMFELYWKFRFVSYIKLNEERCQKGGHGIHAGHGSRWRKTPKNLQLTLL